MSLKTLGARLSVPDGENPTMIRRSISAINEAVRAIISILSGEIVVNDSGTIVRNDDLEIVRTSSNN